MGLRFFDWLLGRDGKPATCEITCADLMAAAEDFQVRQLCFWTCVNMVANAVGRCEVKTFRKREEVMDREYYLWNFEPNANQNSTAFFHKLIGKLYADNEALIISSRRRDGTDAVLVADSWQQATDYASRMNEYTGVRVGDTTYDKTFRESEVLHLELHHNAMTPVINALYASYRRLLTAAMSSYQWDRGQHWKVHVSQLAQGAEGFEANFSKMLEDQLKPFFGSGSAVLPEFDGYAYEQVSGGTGGSSKASDSRDVRNLVEDIFDFTARGFLIPAVLVNGTVRGTADANSRFLTNCIDPICDQLQEEITRKRFGYDGWSQGQLCACGFFLHHPF
ncbi:MAG: phage portal protein [Oscillospiraceae bacterium]